MPDTFSMHGSAEFEGLEQAERSVEEEEEEKEEEGATGDSGKHTRCPLPHPPPPPRASEVENRGHRW